jgi:transposase InsO family protein
MDEKLLFLADFLRGHYPSFSHLCQAYGISRKTGYKWVKRYENQGIDGLGEQSRRPHQSPLMTPYPIRKAIIEIRTRGRMKPGAKKILPKLAERFPDEILPSRTTIYNILGEEGLIESNKKRKRVPRYAQPFAPVREPNEVWSTDFKGQMKLANGKWCYPLTIMDHDSRYLLDCHGLSGTTFKDTKQRFIRLFKEYGLPNRIRSDNGVPFASRTVGGLSSLSVWWIRLGIMPERIEPGKPQQNGRHERMHRTLKKATARPPATSMAAQQRRFDEFQAEYNEERPHESLNQGTPASRYTASPRPYPETLPEMQYPDYFEVRTIRSSGVVYSHNGQIYVSHLLKGEQVGLEEIDDGVWDIYFGPIRLGGFDIRDQKGGATPYWTIKV